jgi:hypothetical protein
VRGTHLGIAGQCPTMLESLIDGHEEGEGFEKVEPVGLADRAESVLDVSSEAYGN